MTRDADYEGELYRPRPSEHLPLTQEDKEEIEECRRRLLDDGGFQRVAERCANRSELSQRAYQNGREVAGLPD